MSAFERPYHRGMTRWVAFGAASLALLAVVSCRQYLQRADTVNFAGGEAVAANKAIQTIDPWPPEAFRRHHTTSAKRLVVGREHYDGGPPKKGKDLKTTTQN